MDLTGQHIPKRERELLVALQAERRRLEEAGCKYLWNGLPISQAVSEETAVQRRSAAAVDGCDAALGEP